MELLVKYCGGCNCQIDRSRIIKDIQNAVEPGDCLTTDRSGAPYEAGILACGCPSACAWKPDIADLAGHWVILAGKTVDMREYPEEELAAAVLKKIKEIKNGE